MFGPMGVGHHTCHHLYRLVGWQPEPKGAARRFTGEAKRGLPGELRPLVATRVDAGESLRSLARELGVSHESIRRIGQATRGIASAGTG